MYYFYVLLDPVRALDMHMQIAQNRNINKYTKPYIRILHSTRYSIYTYLYALYLPCQFHDDTFFYTT